MDPVSFSDGDLHSFNRYAYGNNNPYRYRDNDGRLPVLLLVPLALKAIDVTLTAIDLIAAYQSDGAAGVAKEGIIAAAGVVVPGGRTLGAIAKHGDEVVTYAAKGTRTAAEAGADLAKDLGRNRVSARTAGGKQVDIDLAGKGHFDKAKGKMVETPHVHTSDLNVGPNGKVSASNTTVRPATMDDIRTARKISERE